MSLSLRQHAFHGILLVILLSPPPTPAAARAGDGAGGRPAVIAPAPIQPLAGDRVAESTARFEVAPGSGARAVWIVVARFRFDPSRWSALPQGSAWTIAPCSRGPVALAPLGLVDPTLTHLWWAVLWTDARGAMHASEVRELTVVPRFANRVAADGMLQPHATGRLPETTAARHTIQLAAGYSLSPDGPSASRATTPRRELGPAARGTYLVQFEDDDPDSARARIESAGGAIVSPISGEAYLVRMNAQALAKLQEKDGRPWIADYEPAYRLSKEIDLSATGPLDVTALLFADGDGDATVAALRSLGAAKLEDHRGALNHLVRFELDRSRLAEASALADVAWIEPTPTFTFKNDQAQWVVQSGVKNSRPLYDHGIRGQGQVVMISDSGVRTNHDMFNDTTLAITGFGDYPTHRKIIAYKPGSDSPDVRFGDDVSLEYHGTHTSGTIAGNPEPFSAAPWSGIAKDARLYFMDVGGAGSVFTLPPDLNDLYQPSYTGNAGGAARISSNSWGSTSSISSYTLSSMQIDQFVWNHPDYLIAFAAGNFGAYGFGTVNAPGTGKNCLTIGATGNGTLENTLASFSSRGPTRDGRRKPTVVAPGDLVTSSIGSTRYTYATYSGTSMATPAVAGAMALIRQYLTDGWYPTGAPVPANRFEPSAALLRAMAVASARNDVVTFRAPDNSIGYGRLTADDVLYFPGDSSRTLLVDTHDGLSNLTYAEYQVQVTNPTRPLKIALCWTDAPANPASQVLLVNDLDLVVTHNGLTYRGNYLINNVSVAGGLRDSLNVEEFVRLPAPGPGPWTVRVEGHRVLQGPQPFALCITGGVGGPNGAIALDRFQYGLSDTLDIEVIDTDAHGTIDVLVASGTEPWGERVSLAGGNGVYRGSIPLAPVAALVNDGVLAVTSGDLITARYRYQAANEQVVATARVNVQAPTISNVHASAISATQAVVTWTTDLPATSRVRFGALAPVTVAEASGSTIQHTVLLSGLGAETTYHYDVESATRSGDMSRDSLDGAHRSFTTRRAGSIALLMDDPSSSALETWNHALAALGWEADVFPAAANDPPLIGNTSAGLRSYDAVLWQVGPDNYPPFSDAQRAAVDSLLEGGGRLLVTGHDIGYGLSDAGAPSYTPEREAWIESGLKTRYYIDNLYADTLAGVPGSPVSGAYADSVPLKWSQYPDAGDNVGNVPGMDGIWSGDWTDNKVKSKYMGMHWDSGVPRGTPGVGVWGGQNSRLVGMFFEWCALAGASTSSLDQRTGVLHDAVSWLLGHRPPEVHITEPQPGAVVTGNFLSIHYAIQPDAGRTITGRWLEFSLDGGESWAPVTAASSTDSVCIWDLTGALGGAPTPNSTRVMLRARVIDDGSPALQSTAVMSGVFTLARARGDKHGPVLVAGSATCNPLPVRSGRPTTLFATFSDAETGGGGVTAAEYSVGDAPAAPGSGAAMAGAFGGVTVQASAALATGAVTSGNVTYWVRGRDAAGNWGAASALIVPSSGPYTLAVGDAAAVDFLAAPAPNPFRSSATIHFGLARAGDVRLELYDLAGRRVRTLASGVLEPGQHASVWDGRDQHGQHVGAGIYFLRLTTPSRSFQTRVVALR